MPDSVALDDLEAARAAIETLEDPTDAIRMVEDYMKGIRKADFCAPPAKHRIPAPHPRPPKAGDAESKNPPGAPILSSFDCMAVG